MFEANDRVINNIVQWIRKWFEVNGKDCNAVVGISGGKDSTITAALLVEALGKNRVFGVMMPNGKQKDIYVAADVCDYLDIQSAYVNIESAVDKIITQIYPITEQAKINLPARIRMSTLYAVSQSVNGRVANTCNLSEDWVGYSTRYGDSVGDFAPLSNYTVTEVRAIGKELGLPSKFVFKTPSDGLCGKSDEDNLGFTYDVLDKYIRTGVCKDEAIKAKIDELHEKNKFKLELMQSCPYYT